MEDMRKIKLNKDEYDAIREIDFSEIYDKGETIMFDDADTSFEVSDYGTFEIIVSEEIDTKGLENNQEDANAYGRLLESMLDRLL